jgi:RHS repeat-associated protein
MKRFRLAASAAGWSACCALVQAQTLPPPPVSPAPVTRYEYDAQGQLTRQTQAPEVPGFDLDTGTTTLAWDANGTLRTRTDSRGVLATYRHDPDHRLTSLVFSRAGEPELSLGWSYSQTGPEFAYGGGRLTSSRFPAGSALYCYTGQGRPAATVQRIEAAGGANPAPVVHTVAYTYTRGKLTALTYPSGGVLSIGYTQGQATSLSFAAEAGAVAVPLLGDIRWEPFGSAVRSWAWQMQAGPLPHERWRDLSGRIVRQRLGSMFRDLTYDAADRVAGYTHWLPDGTPQPALDQQFGYDGNGRLTSVVSANASWALSYDASGNRSALSLNGSASGYAVEPASNRLAAISNPARSFSHDSAGHVTGADYSATYHLAGQLATLTRGGVTTAYSYDAGGQRIRKSDGSAAGTLIFVHDHQGHLLGEYDAFGAAVREYVWLGHIPVAIVLPAANADAAPQVHFIHADHLDTPRLVVDLQGTTRWRWLAEPFGSSAPEVDPSGLGPFTFPLRFPGQYADAESGLFYNGQRYYDPQTGRYHQSDPIGLVGGINTYSYVDGQPTGQVDPDGLQGMPMPGVPIPLPPAAVPGTAENKVLAEATIRAIQAASEAVSNVYGRCAQALGRAWDRMFSESGEGADEQKLPELDSTGKVHGSIPDHLPEGAKPEQLNELKDDLKKSIETRKNEQNRLGEDGPHRERIRQEERLLRQIEKKLSGS